MVAGFTTALDDFDSNRLLEVCGQEKSCRQLHSNPTNDGAQLQQQQQKQQSGQMYKYIMGVCCGIPVAGCLLVLSCMLNNKIARTGHTGRSVRDRTVTKTCIKLPVVTI